MKLQFLQHFPRIGRFMRPSKWKVLGAAVAALIVIGLAVSSAKQDPAGSSSSAGDWYEVRKTDFAQTITASGELAAENQVDIKNKVESGATIIELVDEGTSVKGPVLDDKGNVIKPGQIICRLSDDSIKDKLEQASLELEKARADKIAADQALSIGQSDSSNDRRAAEVKLELARLKLDQWKSGDDIQKKRSFDLALEKAHRTLKQAEDNLALSRELKKEDFISQAELENDELKAIEARSGLETAKLDLEVYDKYARKSDFEKAQSDVDQANSELTRTLRKSESNLASLTADLDSKARTLKIREDRVEKLNEQLGDTVVRAPRDGLLIYSTSVGRGRRWGDSTPISQGREVRFNESIFTIPDTRLLNAMLKVHEAMIAQVKVGQRTTVTIDALPGRVFEGSVDQIAVTPEDGGWFNPDLREYKVTVKLPADLSTILKPAMRCSGKVLVGQVTGALAVPVQAVSAEGRSNFVYVSTGDGQVKKCRVRVGRSSETMAEITSGLTQGQRVLLRQPRAGELVEDKSQSTTTRPAASQPGLKRR